MLIRNICPTIEQLCERIKTLAIEVDRGNYTADSELFRASLAGIVGHCIVMMGLELRRMGFSPEEIPERMLATIEPIYQELRSTIEEKHNASTH